MNMIQEKALKTSDDNPYGMTSASEDAQLDVHRYALQYKYDDPEALSATQTIISTETGRERVRNMFREKEIEGSSPEYSFMLGCSVGVFASTMAIAYKRIASTVREDFIRENKLTKFETRQEAVRMLNDQVIIRTFSRSFGFALRTSVFTSCLLGVSQTIAVYRNKSSPFEYAIGAGIAGALARFHGGPRASFAAGIISGSLGLVAGAVIYGLMLALDSTQDRMYFRRIYEEQLKRIKLERLHYPGKES